MPRYFFHVKDGKDLPDTEGTELSGVAEARNQAITTAGEIIKHIGNTWDGPEWRMDVTDERRDPVVTLRFSVDDHCGTEGLTASSWRTLRSTDDPLT